MKKEIDISLVTVVAVDSNDKKVSCKIHELVFNETEGIYYINNIAVRKVKIQVEKLEN